MRKGFVMSDKRDLLLSALKNYSTSYNEEVDMLERVISFVESNNNCFDRTNLEGHITGSALLVNPEGNKVLLTHHKKLNKWLQFWGHSDGNPDTWSVALRETIEESGIEDIYFVSYDILDIDVHTIPKNNTKGEPEHFHYDVRFLIKSKTEEFKISDESNELKWFTFEELENTGIMASPALRRLFEKWKNIRWNQYVTLSRV